MPPASDLAAYASVIGLAAAALIKGFNLIKKRKKEKVEIQEQLDKSPFERESIYLGNIGKRVDQLNKIIRSQSEHIDRQDIEIEKNNKEHSEETEILRIRIRYLEDQLEKGK